MNKNPFIAICGATLLIAAVTVVGPHTDLGISQEAAARGLYAEEPELIDAVNLSTLSGFIKVEKN